MWGDTSNFGVTPFGEQNVRGIGQSSHLMSTACAETRLRVHPKDLNKCANEAMCNILSDRQSIRCGSSHEILT